MDVGIHQLFQIGGHQRYDGVRALHIPLGKRPDCLFEYVHALEVYRVRACAVALLVLRQLGLDDVRVQYERVHGLAVRVDDPGGLARCRQAEHQLHPVFLLHGPVVDVHRIAAVVHVIRAGGAHGEEPGQYLIPQGIALGGIDLGGIAVQRLVVGRQRVQLGDHGIGPELLHGGIVAGHDALVQRPGLIALDHQVIGGNLPGDRLHAFRKQARRIDGLRRLRHAEARGGQHQRQQHCQKSPRHGKSLLIIVCCVL